MGFARKLFLVSIMLFALPSCSLLEVKLESGIEPLPQEQLNMRVFSRDFSHTFYSEVENSADQIALLASNSGMESAVGADFITLKSRTLMWKINSEQALQRTIFQASPLAAMIDTWVLSAQMNDFFTNGNGRQLFGEHQAIAIEASERLQANFERTIKGFVKPKEFTQYQAFIAKYVTEYPIMDITFTRRSAFNDWLAFRNISEFEAVTTFGTVPEVMSDISDRMAMIADQMPKILTWKAELYALHSNINADELQKTLASISDTSARFQTLMAKSPEMMASLAVDLRKELTPLLTQLSESTDDKLAKLSIERQALEQMVKNERLALEEMVARERVAAAANLDDISKHTVEVVFKELTNTLKSLILYFVLFLGVIFFAPLGLGVWLGKRMALKRAA
ncbi:chemotaxis protein [Shewanella aestuarii]|uniref:Chemotaxis protein n=1 Tax=Shewanella aestuarii TaxID=1028752 RepID=A0A6G9QNH6_9GAMM|nr:chemotaxis protein [Shewanella aestuarii]QIR15615.1 chemotaxis protein [Shewanella aestuarii]